MAKVNEQEEYDPSSDENVDDLSYDDSSYDEGMLDEDLSQDESWDGDYEEGDQNGAEGADEGAPPPKKKKGGLFNIILILVAILGGGGFAYMKFAAKPAPPVQTAAESPVPQSAAPEAPVAISDAPVETAQAPQPVVAEDGPLLPEPATDGTDQLTAPPALSATDESAAPAPGDQVGAPDALVDTQESMAPVEVASAPPMPAPISDVPGEPQAAASGFKPSLPSAKDIMLEKPASGDIPPARAVPAAAVDQVSLAAVDRGVATGDGLKAVDEKLSILLARMDSFEGRIANLEAGLHQMSSKVALGADEEGSDLSGVKDALAALEQKVDGLAAAKPADAPAPVAMKAESVKEEAVFVPAAEEPKEVPPSADGEQEDAPPMPVAKKPAVESKVAAIQKSEGWVLRSAQPGSAMVASKATGDMRSVKVGDTLPGLGRVLSIQMENGRWVVKGSTGNLSH